MPKHKIQRFAEKKGHYYHVKSAEKGLKRIWTPLGKDYAAALKKWAVIEADNHCYLPPHGDTFEAVIDRYLIETLPNKAEKTQKEQRRQAEIVRKAFGHAKRGQIRPHHVGQFCDALAVRHGPVLANRVKALLSNMFSMAIYWNMEDVNPCKDIKRKPEKARTRYITDEEFRAVRNLAPPQVGVAMDLAYYTGQRMGDVLRIRWADISDGQILVTQGKTGARLAIQITAPLQATINRAKDGSKITGMTIIHTRRGQQYTEDGMSAMFRRSCQKAGVENFHFHDIRGKAATDLERSGLPRSEIQALLGHKTSQQTDGYIKAREVTKATAISRAL